MIHPAPGAEGRPSFTALVANVDGGAAKYVATSRVQTSRQELIDDLQDMSKVHFLLPHLITRTWLISTQYVLSMHMDYRKERGKEKPQRLYSKANYIFPGYVFLESFCPFM